MATELPCIDSLPSGWRFGGAVVNSGRAQYRFDSDQAGIGAATVTLIPTCDVTGAEEVPSDEAGTRRYEKPISLRPRLHDIRSYVFPGGCVTYDLSFAHGAPTKLVFDVDAMMTFQQRSELVSLVARTENRRLCGVRATCPDR